MMNSHVQIHIYEFICSMNSSNMNIVPPYVYLTLWAYCTDSNVDINSKTESIVIPRQFFLCVDDGDGSTILNLTRDLAHEMCRMMSVTMSLSNAYSARFRTL
jgi:hypothetical protein